MTPGSSTSAFGEAMEELVGGQLDELDDDEDQDEDQDDDQAKE